MLVARPVGEGPGFRRDAANTWTCRMSGVLPQHSRGGPTDIQYAYQGVPTLRSLFRDSTTNAITVGESETVSCVLPGTAWINVREASSRLYGYTHPPDTPRTVPGTQGPFQWTIHSPNRWDSEGRVTGWGFGVACSDCRVGVHERRDRSGGGQEINISEGRTTIRAADLPVCPTLPAGELPTFKCRRAR